MATVWFILFLISLLFNGMWIWFLISYAKDWPNLKDDFDSHMQEIYEKLKDLKQ